MFFSRASRTWGLSAAIESSGCRPLCAQFNACNQTITELVAEDTKNHHKPKMNCSNTRCKLAEEWQMLANMSILNYISLCMTHVKSSRALLDNQNLVRMEFLDTNWVCRNRSSFADKCLDNRLVVGAGIYSVSASIFYSWMIETFYGGGEECELGWIYKWSTIEDPTFRLIENDLARTMPDRKWFHKNQCLYDSLKRILQIYSCLDQEVGYCQGMNYVVAFLLLHCIGENSRSRHLIADDLPSGHFFISQTMMEEEARVFLLFIFIMMTFRWRESYLRNFPRLKYISKNFFSICKQLKLNLNQDITNSLISLQNNGPETFTLLFADSVLTLGWYQMPFPAHAHFISDFFKYRDFAILRIFLIRYILLHSQLVETTRGGPNSPGLFNAAKSMFVEFLDLEKSYGHMDPLQLSDFLSTWKTQCPTISDRILRQYLNDDRSILDMVTSFLTASPTKAKCSQPLNRAAWLEAVYQEPKPPSYPTYTESQSVWKEFTDCSYADMEPEAKVTDQRREYEWFGAWRNHWLEVVCKCRSLAYKPASYKASEQRSGALNRYNKKIFGPRLTAVDEFFTQISHEDAAKRKRLVSEILNNGPLEIFDTAAERDIPVLQLYAARVDSPQSPEAALTSHCSIDDNMDPVTTESNLNSILTPKNSTCLESHPGRAVLVDIGKLLLLYCTHIHVLKKPSLETSCNVSMNLIKKMLRDIQALMIETGV